MMVIQLDQEKFEQLLSLGNISPLCVCKHRKVSLAKASMANSWERTSGEANKTLSKPIIVSGKAKQALCKPVAISDEAEKTIKLVNSTSGEAIKMSGDPTTANITTSKLVLASGEAIPIAQAILSGELSKEIKQKSISPARLTRKLISL